MDKQRILNEIQRTAQENDGKPLGKRQFESATGIRESDWSGRYWARWGDAVREAGFTPNTRQPKTGDDALLTQLAMLIREVKRFPTVPEMRMRKRQDATFPNVKGFGRFGSRRELIARLRAFCGQTAEWSDVATICQSLGTDTTSESIDRPGAEDSGDGFVYLALMRVGHERRYKIGKANLVESRTRQIAATLPEELELVHAIRTDDPYGIEGYWHRRFAEKRRGGEWFALTPADVRIFKRRKFM